MAEVTGRDSGRIFPRSLGPACATESHRPLIAEVEVNPRLHPALLLIGMKTFHCRSVNTTKPIRPIERVVCHTVVINQPARTR